jgi:hypothetical protein
VVYSDSFPKMMYMKDEKKRQWKCECVNDFVYIYLHHLRTKLHTVYSGVQDNQLHEITPNLQLKVYILDYMHQIR